MTGSGFPTFAGVLCNLCALIIGVFFLLDAFVKRYFPKASFGLFSLLYLFLVLGSGTFLMAVTPTFYNMPISMGAALSVWGLYFWMRASEEEKLKKGWLFTGAVFMAAVAACRPQFLVFSLLAAVLFGGRLIKQFKKGRQGVREGIKSSLCIFVPFIIIGGLLMYYNKARFGSAFDFGANYNLTTNDMTSRGFHLDRLPFGLFMYLLQPPEIGGRFPFLFASRMSPSYQGITIYEAMYGGFLWYYPICAVFVFAGQIKRRLKEKGLWGFCLLSAALGVLVVCADIQMAGILQRYWSDFGLLFLLPAEVFAMALEERASENGAWRTVFGKGLFWTAAGTMLINGLWLLAH